MPKRLRATSACRSACPASTRRKTKLQASSASDPETLQSQGTKTARKRLSLRRLEVLHGRLFRIPLARLHGCAGARVTFRLATAESSAATRHRQIGQLSSIFAATDQ